MADGTAATGAPELQQIGEALRQLLAEQQSPRTRMDDLSQAVLGTGSAVQVTQAVTEQVVQQVMTQVQQQNQERIGQIAQARQQTQDQLTQVGTALQQMQEQMRNMGQAVQTGQLGGSGGIQPGLGASASAGSVGASHPEGILQGHRFTILVEAAVLDSPAQQLHMRYSRAEWIASRWANLSTSIRWRGR